MTQYNRGGYSARLPDPSKQNYQTFARHASSSNNFANELPKVAHSGARIVLEVSKRQVLKANMSSQGRSGSTLGPQGRTLMRLGVSLRGN